MKHIINAGKSVIARLNRIERSIFVVGAMLMVVALFGFVASYLTNETKEHPAAGGLYTEGVVGAPKFINPVLASSQTDKDLVKLIYSGLLRKTGYGTYQPDLASCTYSTDTVVQCVINPKAQFQDGTAVTAEDVQFTISTLKELANRNPLGNLWLGIEVTAVDDETVKFTLPERYSGFDELLTQGILPKHVWVESNAESIENHPANLEPIGSGPYKLVNIASDSKQGITAVRLNRFRGSLLNTYISRIHFEIYPDTDALLEAARTRSVDGAMLPEYRELSGRLLRNAVMLPTTQVYSIFIKPGTSKLPTDTEKRALASLIHDFQNSPEWPSGFMPAHHILPTYLESDSEYGIVSSQESGSTLESTLEITTSNSPELVLITDQFTKFLATRGVQTQVNVFDRGEIIQRAIRNREFGLLLFGQTYQHPADTFAFWHSSQRTDPGLNITNYASSSADTTIEKIVRGTTQTDIASSYSQLGQNLERDVPAIPFFGGSYQYVLPPTMRVELKPVGTPEERWNNINHWYIRSYRSW